MPVLAYRHYTCGTEKKKEKCTSSRPITRSTQQSLPVQPEESDHLSTDDENEFMSMISRQAPGDDPKTIVPLEKTETTEQVHEVKSVHSLGDNKENMTVDDTQENDAATVSVPCVEVGDNVSEKNEPENSQQTPRPHRSRLPPSVFTYDALGRPTYCWPNIAAVQGGWHQLPAPLVMGQIVFLSNRYFFVWKR